MKPYLAIIVDSLREALASRVLWVLIVGITLVLAALAPLGYRTDLTTEFLSNGDFYAPKKLAEKLRGGALTKQSAAAKAIWSALDEGQQTSIRELAAKDTENLFGKVGALRRALNEVVRGELLYDEATWKDERILPDAQELLARQAELSEAERHRLNRLLIEGAFPEHFRARSTETVTLTYAMLDFPRTWLSEDQLKTLVKDLVLPTFTGLLLGVVAVMVALLVTSNIIPEMFSHGTLHLLLSKPLSRSMIFLSRFFGGCFFVLINVTYLLFGLWILLGVRFEIWNVGLLKCIPLFLFLFIVYFSVSALAGAYWKNAIVAVAIAAALWGVCFVIGVTKEAMRGGARAASLRRLLIAEDTMIGTSENDAVALWSDEDNEWSEVYENARPLHGPVMTRSGDTIVSTAGGGRGPRFARRGGKVTVNVAKSTSGWSRESLGDAPEGTAAILLDNEDRLLALTGKGVQRFNRDLNGKSRGGLFGFQLTLPGMNSLAWEVITPQDEGEFWKPPMDAHCNPSTGDLLVYTRGKVIHFEAVSNPTQAEPDAEQDVAAQDDDVADKGLAPPLEAPVESPETNGNDLPNSDSSVNSSKPPKAEPEQSKYRRVATIDLTQMGADPDSGATIRWYGSHAGVAVGDGNTFILDGDTLKVTHQQRPSRFSQPKLLAPSPDGERLGLLMKNGKVLISAGGEPFRPLSTPRATTLAMTNDQAWVGMSDRSVTSIDVENAARKVAANPPLDNVQKVNRLVVTPLSYLLPMPGELNNTARYLLSGKQTTDSGLFRGTLDAPYDEIDPWTPVVRCTGFVLFMLMLGCFYIERQEF